MSPHAQPRPVEFPTQCHPEIRDRLTKLETLVGETPNEGIRFDISELKTVFHKMELRFYAAFGGGMVLYWVADHTFR